MRLTKSRSMLSVILTNQSSLEATTVPSTREQSSSTDAGATVKAIPSERSTGMRSLKMKNMQISLITLSIIFEKIILKILRPKS